MNATNFDAAGFLRINLTDGQLQTVAGDDLSAIPTSILGALNPGGPLVAAAAQWGQKHGARFAQTAGSPADLQIGALAGYIGGTLAALGYGKLTIETHGHALVFKLDSSSAEPTPGRDDLLCGFLSGFLKSLSPNPFGVAPLGSVGSSRLYLAGNPKAIEQATSLIAQGTAPLDSLARLSGGGI